MRIPYTVEEENWLKSVADWHENYKTLYECFCERFSTRKYNAFRQKCKQLGITKRNSLYYTEQEKLWILEHFEHSCSMKLLYERFKCFSPKRTYKGFEKVCRYELGLFTSTKYVAYRKSHQLPVGTERKGVDGRIYVKCKLIPDADYIKDKRFKFPYWKPKQRKIYEDHYGEIPKNCVVVFLDGNTQNFDVKNLYCINNTTRGMMMKNNWYTESEEHTLTAIKCCELMQALKGRKS